MAPSGHEYWQNGRYTLMDNNTMPISKNNFQENKPPICVRKSLFVASKGSAPINVPDGQMYLQNAGTFTKPVNKNAEPIITKPNNITYLPYFKMW